jgi:DNA end-binding protein Ku
MAARAIWKGEICLGAVQVPVKLYSAARDLHVHFRLLHAADREPVEQVMIDPETEQVIAHAEIRHGLELERGTFVVITAEDRDALSPEASRQIQVEQVLPPAAIDLGWYDRPYYLGPDEHADAYFALAEGLAATPRVAVVRWVMRKKQYRGAISSRSGWLVLETLRSAEQRLEVGRLSPEQRGSVDPRERALAEQLVGMLEGSFEPGQYRDEHRQRVLELIEAKASGRVVRLERAARPAPSPSLLRSLEASLRARKEATSG